MKPGRWLPLAVFIALAALLAAGVWMSRNPDRDALPSPLIGKPVPTFSLPVLHDPQRKVTLAELRGQPFLLNVWGSWCVECRVEHPVLARFADPSRRFDHIFTRSAGQRRYVDLHMHMPADCSLGDAAKMRGAVEQALMDALPGLRASIQLLPTNREAVQVEPE